MHFSASLILCNVLLTSFFPLSGPLSPTSRPQMGRTLRKFKERKEVRHQKTAPGAEDPATSVVFDVPEDSETDPDEPEDSYASVPAQKSPVDGVVKRKVFPLPLQTVEEAILCLEYIDHSFYLVRPEPPRRWISARHPLNLYPAFPRERG
jgi:hypothetical protein